MREVVTGKFRARKQRRCTRPPSLTHARRGRAWLARPFGHPAKKWRATGWKTCTGASRLQNGDHSFPAFTRHQEPRAGRYQWCCQGAYTGQTHTKQAQTDQAHTGQGHAAQAKAWRGCVEYRRQTWRRAAQSRQWTESRNVCRRPDLFVLHICAVVLPPVLVSGLRPGSHGWTSLLVRPAFPGPLSLAVASEEAVRFDDGGRHVNACLYNTIRSEHAQQKERCDRNLCNSGTAPGGLPLA